MRPLTFLLILTGALELHHLLPRDEPRMMIPPRGPWVRLMETINTHRCTRVTSSLATSHLSIPGSFFALDDILFRVQVSKARSQPNCSLVDLQQIAGVLHGVNSLEDATSQTLKIDSFSSGYRGTHHPPPPARDSWSWRALQSAVASTSCELQPLIPHSSLITHPFSLIPHPPSPFPHPSSLLPYHLSLIPHPPFPIPHSSSSPIPHHSSLITHHECSTPSKTLVTFLV